MPKLIPSPRTQSPTEITGKLALESIGVFGYSWRILLFRSVRDGNLPLILEICLSHPTAIHEHFTSGMTESELQWESLRYYEFMSCTMLYIASSYCSVSVVEWILENGGDKDEVCYAKQKACDVVGQCNYVKANADEIKKMLNLPKQPPRAPSTPTCVSKITTETRQITVYDEITNPSDPDGPKIKRPKRVSENIRRCKIEARYLSYWLPSGTDFEVRVREQVKGEWRVERTKATNKILSNLNPDTIYEVQVRAKNSAGSSDFTEAVRVSTHSGKEKEIENGIDSDS